jgi:hypothetical protein
LDLPLTAPHAQKAQEPWRQVELIGLALCRSVRHALDAWVPRPIWIQAVNPSTYILQHLLEHVRLRAEHGNKVVDEVNNILDFRVAEPSELVLCPGLDMLDEFGITPKLIAAGLVGSSRLILGAHEPNEIYGGYAIGFLAQFVALSYLAG